MKSSMGNPRGACPHCLSVLTVRRTKVMSALVREKTYRCSNLECGFVGIAVEEMQRTVVPPRTARPGVDLPLSKVSGHLIKGNCI